MTEEFILKNLGVVLLIFFLWLVGITFAVVKIFSQFTNLTKGTKVGNLVKILEKILTKQEKNSIQLKRLEEDFLNLQTRERGNLQKVSLLRFNPFNDVGGDQSFVITFLDGENSGIIISSLHSRAGTRIYAKPVEKGATKDNVRLSGEEAKGLAAAVNAKNA